MPDIAIHTYFRTVLRLAPIVVLVIALHWGGTVVAEKLDAMIEPLYGRWGTVVLVGGAVAYILTLALPFVPGVEISVALMMIYGIKGIIIVYIGTVIALSLSFLVGQTVPLGVLAQFSRWLHLDKAGALIERLSTLQPGEQLQYLLNSAPSRFLPHLLRHRYLAVAIAFNLPGNSVIGGGGGIGFIAGFSRLFEFPRYVLMVGVAVSPVPLLLLIHAYVTHTG